MSCSNSTHAWFGYAYDGRDNELPASVKANYPDADVDDLNEIIDHLGVEIFAYGHYDCSSYALAISRSRHKSHYYGALELKNTMGSDWIYQLEQAAEILGWPKECTRAAYRAASELS